MKKFILISYDFTIEIFVCTVNYFIAGLDPDRGNQNVADPKHWINVYKIC